MSKPLPPRTPSQRFIEGQRVALVHTDPQMVKNLGRIGTVLGGPFPYRFKSTENEVATYTVQLDGFSYKTVEPHYNLRAIDGDLDLERVDTEEEATA